MRRMSRNKPVPDLIRDGYRFCEKGHAHRTLAILIALAALLGGAIGAAAQDYPSCPITLIVAFPAGGGVDTVGRLIAQKLGAALGQQVIVENKPGAGSVLGSRVAARAAP